jgi:hypothetical protein
MPIIFKASKPLAIINGTISYINHNPLLISKINLPNSDKINGTSGIKIDTCSNSDPCWEPALILCSFPMNHLLKRACVL